MRIVDLIIGNPEVEQVADLLVEGFRNTGASSGRTVSEALQGFHESRPERINRIAIDDNSPVLGWPG